MEKFMKKLIAIVLCLAMIGTILPLSAVRAKAADGSLTTVESAAANANIVTVNFGNGIRGKITFLEGDIFR